MVTVHNSGAYLLGGAEIIKDSLEGQARLHALFGDNCPARRNARKNTMAYGILAAHSANDGEDERKLKIKFDACVSHDITYVSIVQTARASGLIRFPLPYVLTNCHNSLCAVGGTINEDDHVFGLSAAKKYGGVYVPAHLAVIHQYMREMMAGCGKMILGSDSHTRYGALGTMAIGEGGGELSKQLLGHTYDIDMPEVVGVRLTGAPRKGVGPQDVALAIIGAVFESGYVKNKVMEFFGDGLKNLSVEFRNGVDVMTTETTCLSSIWATDEKVQKYYEAHGRARDFKELSPCGQRAVGSAAYSPGNTAYYDGLIEVDLSAVKPMIAMPFHPSNVYAIDELKANLIDILYDVERKCAEQLGVADVRLSLRDKVVNGQLFVDQGVIAGCAGGTFDNICDAADILCGGSVGPDEFNLSVYPASQPTFLSLVENGAISKLATAGATIRSAFCGPCFGAGDVPANGGLSVRHVTRNFPSREGSKPSGGQIAAVALMDARSIAATALNRGALTAATDIDANFTKPKYFFNKEVYDNRVYNGHNNPDNSVQLKFGPNIAEWPEIPALTEDVLIKIVSFITDPVTTTDELIPSGETSSYRSNPMKLAEFTLSRKDPEYVARAKDVRQIEEDRRRGEPVAEKYAELSGVYAAIHERFGALAKDIGVGSAVYAVKPGDGSAREQAASCQRVLGGLANIAGEYATKRYRSNLINWGMLPFTLEGDAPFALGDYIYIPNVRDAVLNKSSNMRAYNATRGFEPFTLTLADMTDSERKIVTAGCLINYYK